ncbi:MAG TPA: sulfatase [Thermoanaerobaculia bacterium]|jgi:arylsulfatase A-like enzyme|nr:sulfatase [Thermoanaerobaculia bacterium]
MAKPRPLARFLILCLFLGCSGSVPKGPVGLLLDGNHAPDVLVQRRTVAWPPALEGNRFLTGWFPERGGGGKALLPPVDGGSARIEIVNLEAKDQILVLDLADSPQGTVNVQAGGRDLGVFPLKNPLEVSLPFSKLPLGRVLISLTFHTPQVAVKGAAIREVSDGGDVRVVGSNVFQAGPSIADLVRPVMGGEALVGSFVPPESSHSGQRFELTVEREDGKAIQSFSWAPRFWRRGRQRIALPVGGREGFVRIRLRALGAGPEGRWEGLGLVGGTPPAKSPETAALPKKEPPRLIVVYVMDALRADRLDCLGAKLGASVTCDRLAREGMLFRAHRSVAPNTLPSTKELFTGTAFVERGGWKLTAEDGPTLAEEFRAAGYHTGLFSGNPHISAAFGTDRGFEHAAPEVLIDSYAGVGYNDNAARVHAAALAWLHSLPPGSKAFLYLHTIHPHNPYDPPEPFRSRFTAGIASTADGSTDTLTAVKQRKVEASPADRQRLAGLYTGSFAYDDAELGKLLVGLAAWAPPAETLVAVTADHGEELFDHGGVLHGYTLYEEMMRIPLILWAPERLRPAAVEAPTNTLDLHVTLLELAGLHPSARAEGHSLLLGGARDSREPRLASASSLKGGIFSASNGRFKVVLAPRTGLDWGQGEGLGRSRDPEYLFDLTKDPGEAVNLAGTGGFEAAWLRSRLMAWIARGRMPAKGSGEGPVDRETQEKLRALGYAN